MRSLGPALLALLAFSISAHAQTSATLNQYRAAPRPEDGFALSGAELGPHLGYAAALHVDYASDPLVFEDVAGASGTELVSLVSRQVTANLALSLGLYDAALLFAGLPVHLAMQGTELGAQPTATGFGPGDLYLGGRLRLYRSKIARVALELTVTAPTGEAGKGARPGVAGDSDATFEPQINAEIEGGPIVVVVNAGVRLREDVRFSGSRFSDVLTFGTGVVVPLLPWARALAELSGESPMSDIGDRTGSPLEALAGFKLAPFDGLTIGVAGGAGILRGYGSPDFRLVGMAAYQKPTTPASAEPEAVPELPPDPEPAPVEAVAAIPAPLATYEGVGDADGDGVPDLDDRCPIAPGSAEGCPRLIRYDQSSGQIELLQAIRFQGASATMNRGSDEVLAEVAGLLTANPEFKLWIEGHMTHARRDQDELATSVQRAAAVSRWLTAHGVDALRIDALGCGTNRPLVPDRGSQRFKNERIELHISHPLPASGIRSSIGCERVPAPAPVKPPSRSEPELTAPPVLPPQPAPKPVSAPPKPTLPAPAPAALPAPAKPAAPAPAPAPPPPPATLPPPKPPPASPPAPAPVAVAAAPSAFPPGVDPATGNIELQKPIRFEEGTATLAERSGAVLDGVATLLRANAMLRILITAHVAEETGAEASRELTRKRAASVRSGLAKRGIAPSRMSAYGCGEARPIAPNNVPWGRKKNDRVELHVLDPARTSGVHSTEGCGASE